MKKVILFLLLLVSTDIAFSFNWNKCRRNVLNSAEGNKILGITMAGSSTSSFVSSTGECAMIGKTDHDAKVFIANNKDKLLQDFAKGEGEYARSFAELYGCDLASQRLFSRQGKKRFFEVNQAKSDEEVHLILKEEIKQINESNGSCQLSNSLS